METLVAGNRYLFDTCVFIDILRNRRPGIDFHQHHRFQSIFVGYSILVETELWQGMVGLRTEHQHTRVLQVYHRYYVNVTIARDAGLFWMKLRHEDKLPDRDMPSMADCIFAATARYYSLRLLSRDKHMLGFSRFGVAVDMYTL